MRVYWKNRHLFWTQINTRGEDTETMIIHFINMLHVLILYKFCSILWLCVQQCSPEYWVSLVRVALLFSDSCNYNNSYVKMLRTLFLFIHKFLDLKDLFQSRYFDGKDGFYLVLSAAPMDLLLCWIRNRAQVGFQNSSIFRRKSLALCMCMLEKQIK